MQGMQSGLILQVKKTETVEDISSAVYLEWCPDTDDGSLKQKGGVKMLTGKAIEKLSENSHDPFHWINQRLQETEKKSGFLPHHAEDYSPGLCEEEVFKMDDAYVYSISKRLNRIVLQEDILYY